MPATEIMNYFKSHNGIELRSRILSLCADVLGGNWVDLHPSHVSITNIRGGLTNLVYLIKRPKFSPVDNQSTTVLLRIQSQTNREKLLDELVIYTSLAENGLGPKLLGIFPGGRFEEFIPSKPVDHDEVTHPRICSLLARILPRFHSTAVPVSKRPKILEMMREWLTLFEDQGNSHVQLQLTSFDLHPSDFPSNVSTNDLAKEIDTVEEFLGTSSSPVVFCHNDLTSGNLLISSKPQKTSTLLTTEENSSNINANETSHLYLVDFEFSFYNYRGFDLANYFCASAITHNVTEFPHYKIDLNKLQIQPAMIDFCKDYVQEAKKLNVNIKSEFILLREIDQFTPVVHLFWAIFNLFCEKETLAKMDCGRYARDRLALYYHTRSALHNGKWQNEKLKNAL
ncbi:hypothetical protein KIN20_009333 [Parelaphostrongylus tenuis]|uniref:Choline kinase n=1 Tax=Parelaphostrongylus tenuis TaxID=148309 RepID=A0AAD5M813_PARTN|nr:hypothetical protein KIN20_009333 [Parelaphostrongylus tenuis]